MGLIVFLCIGGGDFIVPMLIYGELVSCIAAQDHTPPIAQAAPQAPTESPDLVAAIKSEEGFRATPYDDSEGVLTIGYGLNLTGGITRAEADYLLRSRIDHAVQCLERGLGLVRGSPSEGRRRPHGHDLPAWVRRCHAIHNDAGSVGSG